MLSMLVLATALNVFPLGSIICVQAFTKTEDVEISIAVQECCDIVRAIMAVGLERGLSGVRA